MNSTRIAALVVSVGVSSLAIAPGRAQEIPADYKAVLSSLGKSGDFKDGVLKVNIPRTDVQVPAAKLAEGVRSAVNVLGKSTAGRQ